MVLSDPVSTKPNRRAEVQIFTLSGPMCTLSQKPSPRTLFSPSISNPYSGEPSVQRASSSLAIAPRLLIYLSDKPSQSPSLAFPPEFYDLSVPRTPKALPIPPLVLAPMHFNNAAALDTLSQLFLQSLSPDRDPAAAHGFGLAVLNVISADPFDEKIRLAAAVHFKNHLRSRWTPSSSSDAPPPTTPPIPDAEKNQIKALIVFLMLKVPRRIRPQLSEALSIVSSHEFPRAWASPSPISSPTSAPPPTTPPSTASSAAPTPSSSSSAAPSTPPPSASTASPSSLPEVFVKTAQLISANATASSPDVLCPFFESQHFCCETFDSLNSIELL